MAIMTLSLNPTVDVASETNFVRPVFKIRTTNETYDPGGGGVNVARVITELGGSATLLALAGGVTGALLDDLLGAISLPRQIIPIAGNTRISFTVFETETKLEYRFVGEGPQLQASEYKACLDAIRQAEFDYLIASGSLPAGAPPDILGQAAEITAAKGARFILDSSGPGLVATLERAPAYMVKPSFGELESLVGHRLDDSGAREVAADLVRRGRAEIVAVTMGASGALVAVEDRILRVWSPKVEAKSAVGAGDSFVAGMALALSRNHPIEEALDFAVAAGAAAAMTSGTTLCLRHDVMRLYKGLRRQHRNRHGGREPADEEMVDPGQVESGLSPG